MGQGGGENGGTSGGSGGIEFPSTNVLKNEVMTKLDELKATPTERLDILTALLDHAASTPALVQLYDQIVTKLTARIPIVQVRITSLLPYTSNEVFLLSLFFFSLFLCSCTIESNLLNIN